MSFLKIHFPFPLLKENFLKKLAGVCEYGCLQRPEEGAGFLGARVMGSCEFFSLDAGNRT